LDEWIDPMPEQLGCALCYEEAETETILLVWWESVEYPL
jgi:hypothetical protein